MKTNIILFIPLFILPILYGFTKQASGKTDRLADCINLFNAPLTDTAAPQLTAKNKGKTDLNSAAANIKTLKCAPWRLLVGYAALVTELNGFYNCRQSECAGLSSYQIKTQMVLENGYGSPFIFSSNQSISTADQSVVISQADNWAITNTPSGYFVSSVKFVADIIVPSGGVSSAGLDITVTYKKCNGPKASNN